MRKAVILSIAVFAGMSATALAERLAVPIIAHADGLDICTLHVVRGLKAEGDGFLAVRSGPGTSYQMLDKLHNGDQVWGIDYRNGWVGIAYGPNVKEEDDCSPVARTGPYRGSGRTGWVAKRYVEQIGR